jgi:hypothetical protein
MAEGKHSIELCPPGGVRAGVEGVIASDDDLTTARRLYRAAAADNPDRVVLLVRAAGSWRAAIAATTCRPKRGSL